MRSFKRQIRQQAGVEIEVRGTFERLNVRSVLVHPADGARNLQPRDALPLDLRHADEFDGDLAGFDLFHVGEFGDSGWRCLPGLSFANRVGWKQAGHHRGVKHIRADHVDLAPGQRAVRREWRAASIGLDDDHAANRRTNSGVLGVVSQEAQELNIAVRPNRFQRPRVVRRQYPLLVGETTGARECHQLWSLTLLGGHGEFAGQFHRDIDPRGMARLELLGERDRVLSRGRLAE